MKMQAVEKYISERSCFEMPDFQEQFSLSFAEADKTLETLIKSGIIKFCGGFSYKVIQNGEQRNPVKPVYKSENEQEAFFIKALWGCVKYDSVSISLIQRRLSCDYATAARAIDWMEENGYIGSYPDRNVKISIWEYFEKFGNPDEQQEKPEDDDRERYIEERRRALMERLSRISNHDDDDDDDDDEEDGDGQARKDYLENRRTELNARMQQSIEEDDEDDGPKGDDSDEDDGLKGDDSDEDDNLIDLRTILIECLERGLQDESGREKCILGLNDESKFEFEFVNNGCALKISDGCKTLAQVTQTKRKVRNVLKGFMPVQLVGEEICVTIDNPFGTLMALLTLYSAIDAVKKMK